MDTPDDYTEEEHMVFVSIVCTEWTTTEEDRLRRYAMAYEKNSRNNSPPF